MLKVVSVKLLVIVIIDFKHTSTYCLMQGTSSCFIWSDFWNL